MTSSPRLASNGATRLRSTLIALVLATLAPVAILAAAIGHFLVEQQRETFERGAQERTLALSTAVDTMLESSIATLLAFSTARAFDEGDLMEIRDRAARVLATRRDWVTINVALPSGQQVMNLQRPPGAPLPDLSQITTDWEAGLKSGAPWVSNLIIGPATGHWDFAVRVPIVRDGSLKYVLSAVVRPRSVRELLELQNVPAGWVVVVLDANDRIVARTVDPEATLGQRASESLRAALARSSSGWFRGTTIEGTQVYTPYRRSPRTGWALAMGIPASVVDAPARETYLVLGVSLLAAIALALGLATLVGRRISRPIASLARATESIRRGEGVAVPRTASIVELQQLEQALQDYVEAMQAASRAKDEFLAMLSHELRNPLAALTTAAYVLRISDAASPAAAEARDIVARQTDHTARLIEDLLDTSRAIMGKMDLERSTFDLAEAAQATIAGWRGAGRLGRHRVVLDAQPAWIRGDRTRIDQIVSNLLDNALKFTPEGNEVRVEVRAESGTAVLAVSDSGEGIAAEDLARIFEPFAQGEQGLARSRGGMGIGLALVKQLAGLHGGSVAAHSDGPGKGATLTVRLPSAKKPAIQAAAPAAESPRTARRVLLIEDNDDAREMLRFSLAASGYEVLQAATGAAGIALALSERPDVALIDIGLPDLDGYEVARRLRADRGMNGVALVALTGYGQAEDRKRAREAGFDLHLTKPVTTERLQRAIASLQKPA